MPITKPDIVTDEHLEYLDTLRESGATNMFAAAPYIEAEFGVSRNDARTICSYWMQTFSERHSDK
jgi:hypothetical protein